MTTVISHFYNEEYLLPNWLKHHKKIFDHGILIDYASTDNSVQIIKELCPEWDIVNSKNEYFDAVSLDIEVQEIEQSIKGTRMVLNTTEFLVGDKSLVREYQEEFQLIVPSIVAVDWAFDNFDKSRNILDQITYGIMYDKNFAIRRGRSIHNFNLIYPTGRHFESYSTDQLCVIWMGYFPMTEETINRKLQIQNKISDIDKRSGLGKEHHNFGAGLKREDVIANWQSMISQSDNISEKLKDLFNEF